VFRTLINVPLWAILLEVGIPIAAILVTGAVVTLRSDRTDRSNDNLATSAARLSGAYLAFLGTFLAVGVWQDESKWTAQGILEFEYAQAVLDGSSVMTRADAETLRVAMREYASDVIVNERVAQPSAVADTAANRAMKTMTRLVNKVEDMKTTRTAEAAALLRDFQGFQDQRKQRLTTPDMVLRPDLAIALFLGGIAAAVIMGFFPAGRSTWRKWLQVATSWIVIVSIVSTPLLLQSDRINRPVRGSAAEEFLDRLQ